MPSTLKTIPDRELDREHAELLRQRFRVFAAVIGVMVILKVIAGTYIALDHDVPISRGLALLFVGKVGLGVVIILLPTLFRRRVDDLDQHQVVVRAGVLIVLAVATQVAGADLLGKVLTQLLQDLGLSWRIGAFGPLMIIVGLVYTAAAVVVPWSAKDAGWPIIAMLLMLAIASILRPNTEWSQTSNFFWLLFVVSPGFMISSLRYSRIRDRLAASLMTDRYHDLRRDLEAARRIHDQLFPVIQDRGWIKYSYRYRPAREIGGDFLAIIPGPGGTLTIVLLDVTGHGIAAALAVNRLNGEIKRVFGKHPETTPRELILALNTYVCLTLADEYRFATCVAINLDPANKTITSCNAGHPASLLRRKDGKIDRLSTTAAMLGVLTGDSFHVEQEVRSMHPEDAILIYTDGAVEVSDSSDRMLGVAGLEKLYSKAELGTPDSVIDSIERRIGEFGTADIEDDTLLVVAIIGDDIQSGEDQA